MSKLLLLEHFNNYYNRVRRPAPNSDASAASYKAAVTNWWEYTGINFFQNDGIETTQTINFTEVNPAPSGVPDYLIVYDDSNNLKSRWFIIECKHNRKSQFVLTLRRDVLIDYASEIDGADAYIEKGAISLPQGYPNANPDTALFNSEDFSANEVITNVKYLHNQGSTLDNLYIVFYIACDGKEYVIEDEYVEADQSITVVNRCTFPASRTPSGNVPYTIYFMQVYRNPNTTAQIQDSEQKFRAASQITRALAGSGALYDIQLMPYAPPEASGGNVRYNSTGYPVQPGMENLNLKKASSPNKTETISTSPSDFGYSNPGNRVNFKRASQLWKLIIYSPGMAAAYEFNPIKMGWWGRYTDQYKFDVKITFKPISPYIHVVPKVIAGLNGQAIAAIGGDPRGLVVQQDYSLPLIIDQWKTYEMNNKNYMNAFNRETETIELQNKWGLATDIASAVGGTISGGVSGAFVGGGVGAAVGAIGAAATGVIGAVGNQQMREDALDLRKDQFNYNLQNIKALPVLLNRTASNVIDSMFVPFVVGYGPKPEDNEALEKKIKYNGMKIMRIGQIGTYRAYLGQDCKYMKCKLIYINIHDDYHVAAEIARELDKGFYIP